MTFRDYWDYGYTHDETNKCEEERGQRTITSKLCKMIIILSFVNIGE
jgi:hypothetical protein